MTDSLTQYLDAVVSSPASRVGRRLHSERHLAEKLDVGLHELREALTVLGTRGVLKRRRGSGTYVRRIPTIPDAVRKQAIEDSRFACVAPEDLFVPDAGRLQRRSASTDASTIPLTLAVWINIHELSATWRLLLSGVAGHAEQCGHRVWIHSTSRLAGEEILSEGVERVIKDHPCDGHIVPSYFAPVFAGAPSAKRIPTVFHQLDTDVSLEPTVVLGWEEAIQRGTRKLLDRGRRRIAVLWSDPGSRQVHEHEAVARELRNLQPDEWCMVDFEPGSGAVFSRLRSLLTSADPPDGLLVTDDFMLEAVTEAIASVGMVVGNEVGVVTVSHRHGIALPELPGQVQWSRLEFDTVAWGERLVMKLLAQIQQDDNNTHSEVILARWLEGQTA